MKVTLKDGAPRSGASVEVNVSKNGNTLEIGPALNDGGSPPVLLEFYDSSLTVRIYDASGKLTLKQTIPCVVAREPATLKVPALAVDGSMTTAVEPVKHEGNLTVAAPAPEDDEMAAFDAA